MTVRRTRYLPMQKRANRVSRMSSTPTWPVMRPTARSARRRSSPRSSGRSAACALGEPRRRVDQRGAVAGLSQRRRAAGFGQRARHVHQTRAQGGQACAGQRADAHRTVRDAAQPVDLVGDEDPVLPLPLREWAGGRGSVMLDRPCFQHLDHQIGRRGAGAGAPDAFGLDRICRVAQAGGVHQRDRHAAQHHPRLQRVARRARDRRDDRHIPFGERVHQRRLADVRAAGDGEHQTFAQPLATTAIVQVPHHLAAQRRELGQHLRLGLGRQVLVREVDQCLLLRQQHAQPSRPAAIERSQCAIQLAQRLTSLRLGFRGDEVVYRLRLGQVHAAVEKGAPGEFARLGRPGAKSHQRVRHARQHRASAVQVEFRRVLTGVAARPRKPHHHAPVQLLADHVAQPAKRRPPRRRHPPTQRRHNGPAGRPTQPHHRDRCMAGTGCDREDGVGVHAILCHAQTEGAQCHGRAGKPAPPRNLALPAAACRQPGALAPLGAGGAGGGERGKQADPALYRLRRLPLVPRHGARVVRGSGDGGADERPLRQHQGGPRGAAGHRPFVHVGAARDGRAGRLAADHVHRAGRRTVLGRHVFPSGTTLGTTVVPSGADGCIGRLSHRRHDDRAQHHRAAPRAGRHVHRQSGRPADAGAPRRGRRRAAADERPRARRPEGRTEIPQPADLPFPVAERVPHRCARRPGGAASDAAEDVTGRYLRPSGWRLCALLHRRGMAGAAFREDAVRQRPAAGSAGAGTFGPAGPAVCAARR